MKICSCLIVIFIIIIIIIIFLQNFTNIPSAIVSIMFFWIIKPLIVWKLRIGNGSKKTERKNNPFLTLTYNNVYAKRYQVSVHS